MGAAFHTLSLRRLQLADAQRRRISLCRKQSAMDSGEKGWTALLEPMFAANRHRSCKNQRSSGRRAARFHRRVRTNSHAYQGVVREGDGSAEKERRRLEQEEADLLGKIDRYRKIVDRGRNLSTAAVWLEDTEEGLNRVRLEMSRLRDRKAPDVPLPRLEDLDRRAREIAPLLLSSMGREAGALLRQLVDRIDARPYRAFDSDRIVLRAHFSVKLLILLPDQWQSFLSGHLTPERAAELGSMMAVPLVVDLFDQPAYLQHAAETLRLKGEGLKLAEIGDRLGVGRDRVKAALKAARRMEELGLTDPYQLVSKPTLMPGRWKQDELGTSSSQAGAP